MNEYKIMCEVSFPKFDKILDVAIPVNKTVFYVMQMLERIIGDEITKAYKPTGNELLIDKDTGKVYDKNVLIKDSEIKNGSKIVYY